jgi:hypothetical protein
MDGPEAAVRIGSRLCDALQPVPPDALATRLLHGQGMKLRLNTPSAAMLCFMVMTMTSLIAAPKDHDRDHDRDHKHPAPPPVTHVTVVKPPATHVTVVKRAAVPRDVYFSTEHVRVIHEYYAPRHHPLPPGLRKKYARDGHLPPGWERRIEPLPVIVERDMPRLPVGYRRGVIDGQAVVYQPSSGMIIDVTVLF